MSEVRNELTDLIARAAHGDEQAATDIVQHFGPAIRRVVRRRLHPRVRSLLDSIDLTQDVWASFFRRVVREEVFASDEELLAFLIRMAGNKVHNTHRAHLGTAKRDLHRTISLDGPTRPAAEAVPDPRPTPSQTALWAETWRHALSQLPAEERRVALLLRDGWGVREIAAEMGTDEWSVRRLRARALSELGATLAPERVAGSMWPTAAQADTGSGR